MVVHIPGDLLEGGGQILRIAVAMSAITGKAIDINNIRAKRKKPGLAAQHLNGVQLVQRLSQAALEGAKISSTSLSFHPNILKGGIFTADTRTAGSVALLIQIALPCALFSDSDCSLRLIGGTNADLAPPIDYITNVFQPMLNKFGTKFDCIVEKRGFYPVGKGIVTCQIKPVKKLNAISVTEFGEITSLTVETYFAGNLSPSIPERISRSATDCFKNISQTIVKKKVVRWSNSEAFGNGFGVNILGETSTGCVFGSSCIGTRDKSAEEIGRSAAEEILEVIKRRSCVDQYMQDQLLIFMALSHGKSSIRTGAITLHAETAMHVIKQLCDAQFRVIEDGDTNIIECVGIGLINNYL